MIIQHALAVLYNDVTGITTLTIDVETAGFTVAFFFMARVCANMYYWLASKISCAIKDFINRKKVDNDG